MTPATLPLLQTALQHLADDLGDPFRIDSDTLATSLFGPVPACHGVLATDATDALLGAALFSPVTSTASGCTGAYVSDLWVAEAARGQALGQKMLAEVATRAHDLWQARFLKLVSYRANDRARAFYKRLGFREKTDELVLFLSSDAIDQLSG